MARWDTIIRFDEVTFGFSPSKPLLDEVDFSVREGAKITIMGQNGAGKSTIFKLITKELAPKEGRILVTGGTHIAIAKQVMPHDDKTVIAREDQQNSQSGLLHTEYRGITEAVQVQRDPKKPEELYSIKVVRSAEWKIYHFSMWNGIWGEEGKSIDESVNHYALLALGPIWEDSKPKSELPEIAPTCTYKQGKYSVDSSSTYPHYRYTILTNGITE